MRGKERLSVIQKFLKRKSEKREKKNISKESKDGILYHE